MSFIKLTHASVTVWERTIIHFLLLNNKCNHSFYPFRDIFPVLAKPSVFQDLIDLMLERSRAKCPAIDVVVGLESRGFLFGTLLALALKVPFVPLRKKGKLPGEVKQVSFTLEYGTVRTKNLLQKCFNCAHKKAFLTISCYETSDTASWSWPSEWCSPTSLSFLFWSVWCV